MKQDWKKKILRKENIYLIPGILQILLSFWYEKFITTDAAYTANSYFPMDGSEAYNATECMATMLCTRAFGIIIILLLWKFLFEIFQKKRTKQYLIVFFCIFLVLTAVALILYPEMYGYEVDDYVVFSFAIRKLPFYWHSMLTNSLYGGCFMVFPHPVVIPVLEVGLFSSTIAFIFEKLKLHFQGKYPYLILCVLLLPELYLIVMNPYRNSMYAVLCLWVISKLVFDFLEKKDLSIGNWIFYLLSFGLIATWRGEGILLLGIFALFVLFQILRAKEKWGCRIGKTALGIVVFALIYLTISYPQKLGDKIYFGKSYSIVNTMNTLQVIFNQPTSNLAYDGAEEDLAAINAITPVSMIKQLGIGGYRAYNSMEGRDINQTITDLQVHDAFMSAYYRIVWNNKKLYLRFHLEGFLEAIGTSYPYSFEGFSGEALQLNVDEIYAASNLAWQTGKEELYGTHFTTEYAGTVFHTKMAEKVNGWIEKYGRIIETTKAEVVLKLFLPIYILLASLRLVLWDKRKKEYWFLFGSSGILVGELAAIALVMPVVRASYFFPVYFLMGFFAILIAAATAKQKEEKKADISKNGNL